MKAYAKGNSHVMIQLENGENGTTVTELISRLQSAYPDVYMETPTIINANDNETRNKIIISINDSRNENKEQQQEQSHINTQCDEQRVAPPSLKHQVINPGYYAVFRQKYGIELIDIICDMPFDLGSAAKYVFRNGLKTESGSTDRETAIKDLNKAITCIKHYIEHAMCGECLYTAKE